jgi:hypothetical protein
MVHSREETEIIPYQNPLVEKALLGQRCLATLYDIQVKELEKHTSGLALQLILSLCQNLSQISPVPLQRRIFPWRKFRRNEKLQKKDTSPKKLRS